MTLPGDHLRACPDHGVVGGGAGGAGRCPCCATGVEARPGAFSGSIQPLDLQWHMGDDLMIDLLPRLVEDAERAGEGPVYVTVGALPEDELPAGYTKQERWVNAAIVEVAGNPKHVLIRTQDAEAAIDAIKSGDGYVEAPDYDYDRLDPESWRGIAGYYARGVEYDRVDESTLRISMSGFGSDNQYTKCRRELGHVAENRDLAIRTVEAGGAFKDAVVEVSIP